LNYTRVRAYRQQFTEQPVQVSPPATGTARHFHMHATFTVAMRINVSKYFPGTGVPGIRGRQCIPLLVLTAVLAGGAQAQDEPRTTTSQIDRFHASMSGSANDAARWFDSFFEDERFIAEEATSRIRLRPSLLLEEGEAPRIRLSVGARLNVPRFNRKLKLVVSDEERDAKGTIDSQRFTDPETDETNIGLQYTLRDKNRLNTSVTAGVKLGGGHAVDLFIGPRVRKTWQLDPWQLRFTERIRWYTDIGWESRTRLDLERILNNLWFFRGTFDVRAREDELSDKGLRYSIGPTLIQKIHSRAAIEYQWSTSLVTRPNHAVDETGLRIKFRRQIWRKWLFYEVNPQLVFRNNDDFRATPGIEFRVEASFGGLDKTGGQNKGN